MVQRRLSNLVKRNFLSKSVYDRVIPVRSQRPRMYVLLTVQEVRVPLRRIFWLLLCSINCLHGWLKFCKRFYYFIRLTTFTIIKAIQELVPLSLWRLLLFLVYLLTYLFRKLLSFALMCHIVFNSVLRVFAQYSLKEMLNSTEGVESSFSNVQIYIGSSSGQYFRGIL